MIRSPHLAQKQNHNAIPVATDFFNSLLENFGDTELLFTTAEFLESPNAPLELRSQYEISRRGLKLPQPTARADCPAGR
jgi:hypothetical protein